MLNMLQISLQFQEMFNMFFFGTPSQGGSGTLWAGKKFKIWKISLLSGRMSVGALHLCKGCPMTFRPGVLIWKHWFWSKLGLSLQSITWTFILTAYVPLEGLGMQMVGYNPSRAGSLQVMLPLQIGEPRKIEGFMCSRVSFCSVDFQFICL